LDGSVAPPRVALIVVVTVRLLVADNTTFESLTEPPLMPTLVSPRRRVYG
jgi:hypothetical protein